MFRHTILPVFLSMLWISTSEFIRNQFILASYWQEHYQSMGLIFPAEPANGAVWGIWSLVFAILIFMVSKKFSLWQTTLIAWIAGFMMMWLVIGNLNVLPYKILSYAIPLSILEAAVAAFICKKLGK